MDPSACKCELLDYVLLLLLLLLLILLHILLLFIGVRYDRRGVAKAVNTNGFGHGDFERSTI